jgi:hypothetical protein
MRTAPVGSLKDNFPVAESTKRVRPVAGVATEAAETGVKFNPETCGVAAWPLLVVKVSDTHRPREVVPS